MPLNPNMDRADAAIEAAQAAFWRSIRDSYPEVTTGDVDPEEDFRFGEVTASVARAWIIRNGNGIVFTHDQLATLAGTAESAAHGAFGTDEHGTCYEVAARQGEPRDRRKLFSETGGLENPIGFTSARDLKPPAVDARDMVIEVRWLDAEGLTRTTAVLVRPDGRHAMQDQ